MNVKSLLHRLPFFGGTSSVLVCETDGFSLRGAVISQEDGKLNVEFQADSGVQDYRAAVSDLVGNLRAQGWNGKQAVLITPAVISGLIELPVSPTKPRPAIQMQELIRWELEPLLMQCNMYWAAGQLLLRMGHLDEGQLKEVVERQQGKQKGSNGDNNAYSFKRFCELAIDMGYITQEQMHECLSRQEWLRSDSDEMSCGWVVPAVEDDEPVTDGHYQWLVSGVNSGVVRQWDAAFAANKVELTELYPLAGAAAALIDDDSDCVLIEPHTTLINGLKIEKGVVLAVRMQQIHAGSVLDTCLDVYHAVTPPEPARIFLADGSADASTLASALRSMSGREVSQLQTISSGVSHATHGIAHDLLHRGRPRFCGGVAVQPPKPAIWKRVEIRAIAAAILLLLTVLALEASLQIRYELAQAQNKKISAEKRALDTAISQVQMQIDAVTKVQDELKIKEAELERTMQRFDFFAIELPARTAFVQGLLDELSANVNEDVVINMLEETPNLGFRVNGWALHEAAAQRFIQTFKDAMAPLKIDLVDPLVRAKPGPLGLQGHEIHFRLQELDQLDAGIQNSELME